MPRLQKFPFLHSSELKTKNEKQNFLRSSWLPLDGGVPKAISHQAALCQGKHLSFALECKNMPNGLKEEF